MATWQVDVDGSEQLLSRSEYANGELVATYDGSGNRTAFEERTEDGFRVSTTIRADDATHITRSYPDGTSFRTGGTAAWAMEYSSGADARGSFQTSTELDAEGRPLSWVTSYASILSQNSLTVYPDGAEERSYYNDLGQLIKRVDADGVTWLFRYNAEGQREYSALDMDRNGRIDFDGADRITRTVSDLAEREGQVVRRSRTWIWPELGVDSPQLVAIHESTLDGKRSWSTTHGRTSERHTIETEDGVTFNVATAPDGSSTESRSRHGRVEEGRQLNANGEVAEKGAVKEGQAPQRRILDHEGRRKGTPQRGAAKKGGAVGRFNR